MASDYFLNLPEECFRCDDEEKMNMGKMRSPVFVVQPFGGRVPAEQSV